LYDRGDPSIISLDEKLLLYGLTSILSIGNKSEKCKIKISNNTWSEINSFVHAQFFFISIFVIIRNILIILTMREWYYNVIFYKYYKNGRTENAADI